MVKKLKHKEVKKIMKRNEFEEFLLNISNYAQKNLENIIIFSIIAIVIMIAIPLYLNHKKTMEEKALQLLSNADYYLNRPVINEENATMYGFFKTEMDKYEKAIDTYNEIIKTYKNTSAYPLAYLGVANAYYNYGKYKEALEYYNTFIEKFPKHRLIFDALSGRGYCYYSLGKYKEALDEFLNILDRYENNFETNDIKLKIADCYIKLNKKEKAKKILTDIIKEKKDSYWANFAKEKLKRID